MSRVEIIGNATLYLGECGEIIPTLSRFDAVVTDPPYGIKEAAGKNASRTNMAVAKDYGDDEWDNRPVPDSTMELVRDAGKHCIIFGGNYYTCPATSCWLIWDKLNGDNDFADCELAWTNLPKAVRRIRFLWNGMLRQNGEPRGDHPTQKPIGVMSWCLQQLPVTAKTILDPFMGSGTTGVACHRLGLQFTGIERETKYFDAACRRIELAQRPVYGGPGRFSRAHPSRTPCAAAASPDPFPASLPGLLQQAGFTQTSQRRFSQDGGGGMSQSRCGQFYTATEDIWIAAANKLSGDERSRALADIAQMSNRGRHAVRERANKLRVARNKALRAKADKALLAKCRSEMAATAHGMVANRRLPGLAQSPSDSGFRWPQTVRKPRNRLLRQPIDFANDESHSSGGC